jgi:hypothetical protein
MGVEQARGNLGEKSNGKKMFFRPSSPIKEVAMKLEIITKLTRT